MKSYIKFALLFTVNILILYSCTSKKASSTSIIKDQLSMEKIKFNLESDIKIDRESPFILRKFDPELKGEWIGNAISY